MRIISLHPACTEWVAAFGAGGELVGRSHACDHPDVVREVPSVTEPVLDASMFPPEGRDPASDRTADLNPSSSLRAELLAELEPDVIVSLSPSGVSLDVVAVTKWKGAQPSFFSAHPHTFKELLDAALRLGKAIGRLREAMAYIGGEEKRLRDLRLQVNQDKHTPPADLPGVVCIDWIDPIRTAGLWVPGVVELAGGRTMAATEGEPPRYADWATIVQSDPDVLAIAPMGSDLRTTVANLKKLAGEPGWKQLKAVREGRVFAFDGKVYFNRPGPRLYRGVELLASALYPERWSVEDHASEMAVIRT